MSHASSSKICKYDVFLSFRGKDTRRTFVSHLYEALEQRRIRTFKDDERLEAGKSISAELLKAIEEARFAVVIFSESYASSRWCLEELAHINTPSRMLTYLSLDGCSILEKLPKFDCMESLETLNLCGCTSLQEFPEICGDMQRLSILHLESPWIRSLPPSLSGLRELHLAGCEILESIPDTIQNLSDLSIFD
ncbi:hypothetical protein KY285_009629 [Solanum tuberosum]|nr:hypothetical protein KY285_009629 [Solanum tuberosum]